MVGAIHGRLLTAWSTAGVIGPVLITSLREAQLAHGVAKAQAYDVTMYILVGLLVVGLVANALVRPLADRHFMSDAELAAERKVSHEHTAVAAGVEAKPAAFAAKLVLAWLAVGLPIVWGVWITLQKTLVLV